MKLLVTFLALVLVGCGWTIPQPEHIDLSCDEIEIDEGDPCVENLAECFEDFNTFQETMLGWIEMDSGSCEDLIISYGSCGENHYISVRADLGTTTNYYDFRGEFLSVHIVTDFHADLCPAGVYWPVFTVCDKVEDGILCFGF